MRLPYVIDNHDHTLADVLNDLLRSDAVHALDVATAYINVGGFDLVQDGLEQLAALRLLLGSEPGAPQDLGLGLPQSLRHDLDEAPFDQETYHQVETLIRFLRREHVAVRLYVHAKAYLCFVDRAPGNRFTPVAGVVGSSNFTRAGLTTNQELNLTHKSVAEDSAIDEAEAAVAPLLDTFNTLQRIADEDWSVLDELEAESELASSELGLEELPDGIHSGRERVIADVLGSVEHRQAVEAAPKIPDGVQQLAETVLQAQRNKGFPRFKTPSVRIGI